MPQGIYIQTTPPIQCFTFCESIPVVSENVPEQAPALHSSATLGDGTITKTVAKTNDHTDKELVAMDKAQLATYDTLTVTRLYTFANYSDAKNLIYAVENIPPTATWGISKPIHDKSTLLCDPSSNMPCTVWLPGFVSRVWLFDPKGETRAHVSISVVLFGVNTASATHNIIDNLSFPNGGKSCCYPNEECWGDIRALHWQSAYKAQGKTPKPFTDVYDARKVFKPKSEMDYYGATNLQMGDAVLMEAYIKHYRLKGNIDKLTPSTNVLGGSGKRTLS
ncbi:hypothetical protein SERLA73DRAFT_156377 [Serpula lacrymans var. lacrymans S7.3]|uniref:Uncharacterized protein n=1 Tax=Serpula lacrymans var. lacrymans (strain S7.3) TaxID=936435 RepID=F8QE77_SERL3|nr:hypothetical protein SERLA73DRAFT_156377 [Serpula lacrymans var. lacrymans S7.3]